MVAKTKVWTHFAQFIPLAIALFVAWLLSSPTPEVPAACLEYTAAAKSVSNHNGFVLLATILVVYAVFFVGIVFKSVVIPAWRSYRGR